MLFDIDIFIWVQRGNKKAVKRIDAARERTISVQTYMEILEGSRDKAQLKQNKDFLKSLDFVVLPFTEKVTAQPSILSYTRFRIVCGQPTRSLRQRQRKWGLL